MEIEYLDKIKHVSYKVIKTKKPNFNKEARFVMSVLIINIISVLV